MNQHFLVDSQQIKEKSKPLKKTKFMQHIISMDPRTTWPSTARFKLVQDFLIPSVLDQNSWFWSSSENSYQVMVRGSTIKCVHLRF